MSFLPIGFAECAAVFTIPGDAGPALVVTGHDVSGHATSIAVADAITDGWDTADPLPTGFSDEIAITSLEIRWQAAAGDPVLISRNVNIPGLNTNDMAPPQVAVLMRKVSGFAGRANRGRSYIPGITENAVDAGGFILAATLVDLAARGAGSLSAWGTGGAELVILHTDPAITPRPVVEWVPAQKVATQRRRLR